MYKGTAIAIASLVWNCEMHLGVIAHLCLNFSWSSVLAQEYSLYVANDNEEVRHADHHKQTPAPHGPMTLALVCRKRSVQARRHKIRSIGSLSISWHGNASHRSWLWIDCYTTKGIRPIVVVVGRWTDVWGGQQESAVAEHGEDEHRTENDDASDDLEDDLRLSDERAAVR